MKRNSKRNKKIRNLLLVCVMMAVVFTAATYAWFIGMQTVKVNSFEVEIAAVDSLMLSMDGNTWETTLDVTSEDTPVYDKNANEFLKESGEGLKPISSIGEFDDTSSRLKLFEKGSLTATDGGYRLMASQVNNYTTKVTDGTEYLEGDGYVAFDLFIMNLTGDEYYAENNVANEEAIYLTYDSNVTAGATSNTYGIENSVRVAFAQIARVEATKYGNTENPDEIKVVTGMTCTDENSDVTGICRDAQIWEPNENTHTADAVTWYNKTCEARVAADDGKGFKYNTEGSCAALTSYIKTSAVAGTILADNYVDVYDGSYNTYTGTADTLLKQVDTFTDSEKLQTGADRLPFMTLAPNSITKVRVYIWIEGQDIDNYDFASLGNSIKVNFGFTKERFTSGEIGSGINPGSGAEQLPEANS